jgi:6-phosphogluconolactonase
MKTERLFCGRITESGGKGLHIFEWNNKEGTINFIAETDAGPNPSYFCISESKGLIYAANEVTEFNGLPGGGVTTLHYNSKTGSIQKLHELSIPHGSPCFISLSPDKKFLLLANYTGSSITVVKLDEKGIPAEITDSILYTSPGGKVSHPHMIAYDPGGKRIYLTDLGLDRVVIFELDKKTGRLSEIQDGIVKLPEGSGPRHFIFSRNGKIMYVINELNSTVSVFRVDEKGGLVNVQTITTLNEDFSGKNYCADIHLSKNGDFLYGSNRGENTIVTYRILNNGLLDAVGRTSCGGEWPRNFVIDPWGKFLLVGNQRSGNLLVVEINQKTGIPIEPGKEYKIGSPVCLKFLEGSN